MIDKFKRLIYLYTLNGPRRSFRAYIPCGGQASDNVNIWKAAINLEIKKKKRLLSDKELSQSPCTLLQERKRSTSFMKLYQTRHKKELTPKKRNKRLREEAGQCRSS